MGGHPMFDFFEFSNEMLCVADDQGRFTRVNPAWTKTLGWSAAELTSRPYLEFVHPDDQAATIREAELLNTGEYETVDFENRYRTVDGSYRWLSWKVRYVRSTKQLVAAARDVTANKLQAQALREAEERFRVVAMNAPVGIFQDEPDGRCVFVNRYWTELTGLSYEESLGFGWMKAVHPEDLQRAMAKWQACAEAQVEYRDEYRLVRRDGSEVLVVAAVQATHDAAGAAVGYLGTLLDITDRKLAEEQLRLRESQLAAILDNTPSVIYLKDAEGRYRIANFTEHNEFQHLNDVIGKTDLEIFPEEVARGFMRSDQQVWSAKVTCNFEEVVPHRDGRLHTYRSNKFPVFDENGAMMALGGISTDITDLREAHEMQQRQQELLRNLIEVQECEKQFLCHEFHDGLIQYAVGSLMLLESFQRQHSNAPDTDKITMAIASLRKGVEDGRRVIRGIRPAVLDDSGLAAAVEDLIGQYSTSGMMVTSDCDPDIGRLPESIQTTVYRVIQEALNNAHKYSGTDVVRIELHKTNGELFLEIQDFGCGFDVEASRKRGFGLLGMTERVRLLGGQCTIHSEPDVGTRVSVRLPITQPATSSRLANPTSSC